MLEKIDELLVEAANFNSSNKDEIEPVSYTHLDVYKRQQ